MRNKVCFPVLGMRIDAISYQDTIQQIREWQQRGECRYICAANVHMAMESYDDDEFRRMVNHADIVTPDGVPLVWLLRLKGVKVQQRVYGPTLMLHVLEMAAQEKIPVGFYGGDASTLDQLLKRMQDKYPGLNAVYSYSPPFRALTLEEDADVVAQIKESGTRILFVGLGCPKQERWMAAHRGKIHATMLGVGAAFNIHAGKTSQAPVWMQNAGLEWAYRFFQEPGRLWKRYLIQNPRFVLLALADLIGILKMPQNDEA